VNTPAGSGTSFIPTEFGPGRPAAARRGGAFFGGAAIGVFAAARFTVTGFAVADLSFAAATARFGVAVARFAVVDFFRAIGALRIEGRADMNAAARRPDGTSPAIRSSPDPSV
jgi:hypothetical protein